MQKYRSIFNYIQFFSLLHFWFTPGYGDVDCRGHHVRNTGDSDHRGAPRLLHSGPKHLRGDSARIRIVQVKIRIISNIR